MRQAMKNVFENKVNRFIAFVAILGIFVIVVYTRSSNYILEKRLDKNGIECNAVIIGTWFIPKKGTVAIYMFSAQNEYFTGQFIYPSDIKMNESDIVVVKYNAEDPDENICTNANF